MRKLLVMLAVGLMMAVPMVASAAGGGSTRGSLPPAVDQMLAQDMIQLAQSQLKMAGLLDETTRRLLLPGFHDSSEG